jgi:hypothetical protein
MRNVLVTALLAGLTTLVAVVAPSSGAPAAKPPKLLQLSYDEAPGSDGPDRVLDAFSRRTESVRFHMIFKGDTFNVPGKYDPNVTDTDIHGNRAKHPWKPDRKHGGSQFISLVHRSLQQRGVARVTVRARGNGQVDVVRFRIDLMSDECVLDPPLYPISCEVPAVQKAAKSVARRSAAERRVNGSGVGRVKLGTPFARLHKDGLVGPQRPGCPLDQGSRSARLKPPLKGGVDLAKRSGRRVASVVTVTGGAHARRVKIGSTKRQVRRSYPEASFHHGTEDVFGITLVNVPRSDGGRFQMGIDVDTGRVTVFSVPHLLFCE